MRQVLTLNKNATHRVEILRKAIEFDISVAKLTLADGDDEVVKDGLAKLEAELEEYDALPDNERPVVIVKYLSASKKTELMHRQMCAVRGKSMDSIDADTMGEVSEVHRESLAHGVSAWENFGDGFDEAVKQSSFVEQAEHNGWLHLLYSEITSFNSLSEEKKRA